MLLSLPKYLIEKVQLVQNCAARLVVGRHKYDHSSPVLKPLHWLPVEDRIVFKILLLTYKALNNQAPFYIRDMLDIYVPARKLRLSSKCLLKVPISNIKSYGDRAFSVAAPKLWNQLPLNIRLTLSSSVVSFKSSKDLFIQ